LVVLDTCALLWLAGDPSRLSERARQILVDPSNTLSVSAISAWEIAIKTRKGRLELPATPDAWWAATLSRYQINELPVSAAIAFDSVATTLPHNDPADRLIVSTARVIGAQLLTADRLLLDAVTFATW
jgi:PIN domain nuclease of toxin-antitoxin system